MLASSMYVQSLNVASLSGAFAGNGTFFPGQIYSLSIVFDEFSQRANLGGMGDLSATLLLSPAPSPPALALPVLFGAAMLGRRRRA